MFNGHFIKRLFKSAMDKYWEWVGWLKVIRIALMVGCLLRFDGGAILA